MTAAIDSKATQKRGFVWWLSAVIATVGILGGPLAIADLLAGVVEWRGLPGYLVAYWGEYVSAPFGTVLNSIARFLALPRVPEGFVDYIAIGILNAFSVLRAAVLFGKRATLIPSIAEIPHVLMIWLAMLLLWPAWMAFALWLLLQSIYSRFFQPYRVFAVRAFPQLSLGLAPVILFIALYAANALESCPHSPDGSSTTGCVVVEVE